jgi:hypothetical protein
MSSLYDKYYSQHNRTYMYNLIKNLILKDHTIDISTNDTYNQFFETNFMNTFKSIDTEDIKDLNNHLLTTQMEYFQNFIIKQPNLVKPLTQPLELITTDTKVNDNKSEIESKEESTDFIIHSIQRNINLQNSSRHNFRIENPMKQKKISVDKVIIPIEDTQLFMNPLLLVSIDTQTVELHLRGTITLRNRDYGIYSPFYETILRLNSDICRIQFKNQLYNVRRNCDVYKIKSCEEDEITLITTDKNEFKIGDYIRICNFENMEIEDDSCLKEQYKIIEIINQGHLCLKLNKKTTSIDNLYVMNISLQNTIYFS